MEGNIVHVRIRNGVFEVQDATLFPADRLSVAIR